MSETVSAMFVRHCRENQVCPPSDRAALAVQQVKELLQLARRLEAERDHFADAYVAVREIFKIKDMQC